MLLFSFNHFFGGGGVIRSLFTHQLNGSPGISAGIIIMSSTHHRGDFIIYVYVLYYILSLVSLLADHFMDFINKRVWSRSRHSILCHFGSARRRFLRLDVVVKLDLNATVWP